jgi:hypothetical protein
MSFFVIAAHCWHNKQIPTHEQHCSPWNNAVKRSTKLITSLHSERYRPSGVLVHRQNLYAPRSRWCTGRREAQRREPVNKIRTSLYMANRKLQLINKSVTCLHQHVNQFNYLFYKLNWHRYWTFSIITLVFQKLSLLPSSGKCMKQPVWPSRCS